MQEVPEVGEVQETPENAAMNARLNDKTIQRKTLLVEFVAVPLGLSQACSCGNRFQIAQEQILKMLMSGATIPNVCPKCDADIEFAAKRIADPAQDRIRQKFGLNKGPKLVSLPGLPK